MALALRSQSSLGYASRTNTTLSAPAGITNGDILVAVIFTELTTTAPTPAVGSTGFTAFGTATSVTLTGDNGKLHLYWKRAASEAGSYTFTHSACSSNAWMGCFSGGIAAGAPLTTTSNNTGNGTTSTGTGITTTAANSWLLYAEHSWDAVVAMSPPTGMTEQFESVGGAIYIATQLIATASATGNRTQTNSNSGAFPWAVRMVELLVDSGGGVSVTVVPGAGRAVGKVATVTATAHRAVTVVPGTARAVGKLATVTVAPVGTVSVSVVPGRLRLVGSAVAVTATGEVTPEVPAQLGGPGPAGPDRRRFEIFLLPEEDEQWQQKSRRKRRVRLPARAEIEDKVAAAVAHIAAGSPQPMSQNATVAQVSTLMNLNALLEIDRRRVERTIYQYLAAMLAEEEEEEALVFLLAA